MSRRRKNKRKTGAPVLQYLNPNAAGVDVGATEIYIAVPADRDPHPVRRFWTFTEDLRAAAAWLKSCCIETVAMESTGVYWIPLFQILEAQGAWATTRCRIIENRKFLRRTYRELNQESKQNTLIAVI
jgi:transposase